MHDLAVQETIPRSRDRTSKLEISEPTVDKAVAQLNEVAILREITGRQRGRVYVYHEYLALLNEGTEAQP